MSLGDGLLSAHSILVVLDLETDGRGTSADAVNPGHDQNLFFGIHFLLRYLILEGAFLLNAI